MKQFNWKYNNIFATLGIPLDDFFLLTRGFPYISRDICRKASSLKELWKIEAARIALVTLFAPLALRKKIANEFSRFPTAHDKKMDLQMMKMYLANPNVVSYIINAQILTPLIKETTYQMLETCEKLGWREIYQVCSDEFLDNKDLALANYYSIGGEYVAN